MNNKPWGDAVVVDAAVVSGKERISHEIRTLKSYI